MRIALQIQMFVVIGLVVILVSGCTTEPTAAFTADKLTITAGESVQFTDQSINEPTTWLWTFTGGTPSTSTLQDPTVTYSNPGIYTVSLEVRKRKDSNIMTKDNYITVEPATTDLTFINNTYTDVTIVIGGVQKIAPGEGGEATYFNIEASSISYRATTSGSTSTGTQIGILLVWEYTLALTGGDQETELGFDERFFFLRMTNNGTHDWGPIEVDHGAAETAVENILLPMNGTRYNIGYYNAYASTEVRAYWDDQPDTRVRWTVNEDFTFSSEWNQNVSLTNYDKKSVPATTGFKTFSQEAGHLVPSTDFIPPKTPEEGITRHFPNR